MLKLLREASRIRRRLTRDAIRYLVEHSQWVVHALVREFLSQKEFFMRFPVDQNSYAVQKIKVEK